VSSWADTRDAVCAAVDDGRPIGEIEALLLNGLPDEQAAALWLYAWSLTGLGAVGAERRTTRALAGARDRSASRPRS
jgi:hypothetical protein